MGETDSGGGMNELSFNAGGAGDKSTLNIYWSDHNNIQMKTILVIKMLDRDKPRTLVVEVNGVRVATLPSEGLE